jgi:uncharacterized membrane protein YdbT with pleckstrin-like domain
MPNPIFQIFFGKNNLVNDTKGKDETIIWSGKPAILPFLLADYIKGLILLLIIYLIFNLNIKSPLLWIFAAVALLAGVARYRFTHFNLTNYALVIQTGLFQRSAGTTLTHQFDQIDLRRITKVSLRKSLFDKISGSQSSEVTVLVNNPERKYRMRYLSNSDQFVVMLKKLLPNIEVAKT